MANTTDNFTVASDIDLQDHVDPNSNTWDPGYGNSNTGTVVAATDRVEAGVSGVDGVINNSVAPATAEYDVSLDVNLGTATRASGPAGRSIGGATNDAYFVNWRDSTGQWRLVKADAAVETILATYTGDSPSTTRTVLLQLRNATKKVFIGGVERISSTDNAVTATGNPGIFSYAQFSGWWVDNFSSTDVAGVTTPFPPFHHRVQITDKIWQLSLLIAAMVLNEWTPHCSVTQVTKSTTTTSTPALPNIG